MRRLRVSLTIVIVGLATVCHAEEPSPHGISTPGTASVEVWPDELEVELQLATEASSFPEAVTIARGVVNGLQNLVFEKGDLSIAVEHDLEFMKIKKWGKDRQLEHAGLLVQAVADARHNAVAVATAGRLRLAAPRRIVVGSVDQGIRTFGGNIGLQTVAATYRKATPFTIHDDLTARIGLSVGVFVDFEAVPE